MNSDRKTVVLIEDNEVLRKGFTFMINGYDNFEVVGEFSSCEEAIKTLPTSKPDIILMDIELPGGMSGIEGTRIIKEKFPAIEVIIVTVFEDSESVFEAIKSGASGYITKGANRTELLLALKELVAGGAPMSGKIARLVLSNFYINPNSPLTKRETQVLQMIAAGKTYTQISDELFISKDTTKTHIRNIYTKLQVRGKAGAIEKATKERLI